MAFSSSDVDEVEFKNTCGGSWSYIVIEEILEKKLDLLLFTSWVI